MSTGGCSSLGRPLSVPVCRLLLQTSDETAARRSRPPQVPDVFLRNRRLRDGAASAGRHSPLARADTDGLSQNSWGYVESQRSKTARGDGKTGGGRSVPPANHLSRSDAVARFRPAGAPGKGRRAYHRIATGRRSEGWLLVCSKRDGRSCGTRGPVRLRLDRGGREVGRRGAGEEEETRGTVCWDRRVPPPEGPLHVLHPVSWRCF